jgi:hypothetical protein
LLAALACSAPHPQADKTNSNEEVTINQLRTISTACVTYLTTYGGYPHSLAELGPYPDLARSPREIREHFNDPLKIDAHHASLIDEKLAAGKGSGYIIIYRPVTQAARGTVQTFSISARPEVYGQTGLRSFYLDQTRLISATSENRLATDNDAFALAK